MGTGGGGTAPHRSAREGEGAWLHPARERHEMSLPVSAHVPVMLSEVIGLLAPRDSGRYLDGTFGGGGYAEAILAAAASCTLWAIDRDPDAIARGASLAARYPGLHLIHGQFGDMLALLAERGVAALRSEERRV